MEMTAYDPLPQLLSTSVDSLQVEGLIGASCGVRDVIEGTNLSNQALHTSRDTLSTTLISIAVPKGVMFVSRLSPRRAL
jgi:hypothetical protein